MDNISAQIIQKADYYMDLAIAEAQTAITKGEVPIGAVIVSEDGHVLSRAHNEVETRNSAHAHAEMLAIERASEALGNWRLDGTSLFCTLEPCPMCASALVLSRVSSVFYACEDPRMGACGSLFNLAEHSMLPHQLFVTKGLREEECKNMIQSFFSDIRK